MESLKNKKVVVFGDSGMVAKELAERLIHLGVKCDDIELFVHLEEAPEPTAPELILHLQKRLLPENDLICITNTKYKKCKGHERPYKYHR